MRSGGSDGTPWRVFTSHTSELRDLLHLGRAGGAERAFRDAITTAAGIVAETRRLLGRIATHDTSGALAGLREGRDRG